MDALELQAALVKLDPATTVTPIGSNVKLVPHPRISFALDVDESDLTFQNVQNSAQNSQSEKKLGTDVANVRKLSVSNQNHQNSQNPLITKSNVAEVR